MLEIYLGSLMFSWGSILFWDYNFSRKLKKEGLKQVDLNICFKDKLVNQFKDFVRFSIPGFNLVISFIVLFDYSFHYEDVKNRGIAKGYIKSVDENNDKRISYNSVINNNDTFHRQISNQERLEYLKHEKEFLENYYKDNSDRDYTKKKDINSD